MQVTDLTGKWSEASCKPGTSEGVRAVLLTEDNSAQVAELRDLVDASHGAVRNDERGDRPRIGHGAAVVALALLAACDQGELLRQADIVPWDSDTEACAQKYCPNERAVLQQAQDWCDDRPQDCVEWPSAFEIAEGMLVPEADGGYTQTFMCACWCPIYPLNVGRVMFFNTPWPPSDEYMRQYAKPNWDAFCPSMPMPGVDGGS